MCVLVCECVSVWAARLLKLNLPRSTGFLHAFIKPSIWTLASTRRMLECGGKKSTHHSDFNQAKSNRRMLFRNKAGSSRGTCYCILFCFASFHLPKVLTCGIDKSQNSTFSASFLLYWYYNSLDPGSFVRNILHTIKQPIRAQLLIWCGLVRWCTMCKSWATVSQSASTAETFRWFELMHMF